MVSSRLEVAARIGDEIAVAAVWMGERCSWVAASPEGGVGARAVTLTYRALGPDLYGGSAGIGLFMAELARATGDERHRATALGALRHAISHAGELSAAAFYTGTTGVAYALVRAAAELGEPQLEAAARELLAAAALEPEPGELDLMSGCAGALVGLLALRVLLGDDGLLAPAFAHGEALLAGAQRSDGGLCWLPSSMPGAPGLTGLSHGAAGIAVALLELAAATGEERFRAAAAGAFEYERGLFDPAAGNWPDLRHFGPGPGPAPGAPRSFAVFWCHGAPGGALARLRAIELGFDAERLAAEARVALATTASWVDAGLAGAVNYSLCHGLGGNAEVLVEGATLGDFAETADRVAAAGIENYLERGQPWPSGAHGGRTEALFLGLAGIGRFYLRLARPALPSVLLLRPG
jgi:lantibiotic modifying enzyme